MKIIGINRVRYTNNFITEISQSEMFTIMKLFVDAKARENLNDTVRSIESGDVIDIREANNRFNSLEELFVEFMGKKDSIIKNVELLQKIAELGTTIEIKKEDK